MKTAFIIVEGVCAFAAVVCAVISIINYHRVKNACKKIVIDKRRNK